MHKFEYIFVIGSKVSFSAKSGEPTIGISKCVVPRWATIVKFMIARTQREFKIQSGENQLTLIIVTL